MTPSTVGITSSVALVGVRVTSPSPVLRGQVWFASLPHVDDGNLKPFVIVSNNDRNRGLKTYLAARITTSTKHQPFATMVLIGAGEPVVGTVLCDDIELIYPEDLRRHAGGFTPVTMARIEAALRAAFALR